MLYLVVLILIIYVLLIIIVDLVKFYFLNQQNLKTFSYEKNKTLRFKKRKEYNKKLLLKKQLKTNAPSIIIDISKQNLDCTIKKPENIQDKNHFIEPSLWNHSYIYSYDEINYATQEQQDYYLFFKNKFLNEEFIDIKDNTNYAFILYFELLKMYEKHKDYNILSKQFKLLGKILQTDEQKNVFKEIINELLIDKKFNKAFKSIDKISFSQKKKIELNKEKIKESEQKYYSTVKILNSYLSDEDENNNTAIPANINNNITENITLYKKNSIFKPEIALNELQEKIIISIVTSSFQILQAEIDVFARQNGLFKNQLIDSINEVCAEYIDGEVLILEEGDNYIIEEFYYKEILI